VIPMSIIDTVAKNMSSEYRTEKEIAIALHDYVRDHVEFGFNRYFDKSEPSMTINLGLGHCIPKGRLMTALLRAVNIESFLHFVLLPKQILKGAVTKAAYFLVPEELSHCYTEVRLGGKWYRTDSYILDRRLFKAAKNELLRVGDKIGYGTHCQGTNTWEGNTDSFSQYCKEFELADHGRVDDVESYFNSKIYHNRFFGIKLGSIYQLIGGKLEARSKEHLSNLRRQYD
jgi:hypothetical protein